MLAILCPGAASRPPGSSKPAPTEKKVKKMRYLLVLVTGIMLGGGAAMGPVMAQGGPGLMMTRGQCAPGSEPSGLAQFRNVGNNDINEGAAKHIFIRLCSFRPDIALELTASPCQGRVMSQVRFQNVANTDFNEGAPNFVIIRLCIRGPVVQFFDLTRGGCRPGLFPISDVRFKNVADNDFNEGAPNFVSITLCGERN